MPNIMYRKDENGREYAKWPGVSKRVEIKHEDGTITKEPRKEGQKQLGLVINKEANIFYKNEEGFYSFNPEDQSIVDIPPESLPVFLQKTDLRRRNKPVIVMFGGAYFLDALMKGRTVFVIAHRLSTVRNADEILVLEKGEIIERGNHDALMEKQGRYYDLYTGAFRLE